MAVNIPLGPIQEPPYDAIPYTLGESSAPACEAAIREALAGVVLGAFDEQVIDWLSGEASPIVAAFCSLLYRVREVER